MSKAKDRSFTDYVAHRFYNQLFEAVKNHLNRNSSAITTRSQQVRRVDSVWLSDISVKRVLTEDQPGTSIAFDVLVEADYEISERARRYDRYSEEADWFKVSCTADLAQNLNDFRITGIEVYNYRGKQINPLSDALVPIIHKEHLESVAKDFLTEYYPEALGGSVAVNPYTLAERMGLTVEEKSLTPDASIFGQIYFYDCETEHYDDFTGEPHTVDVKAGTVFVDPANFFLRNLGSKYNTIVHECVHWHLHRKSFELERLYNEEATQIQCKVAGGIKQGNTRSATDWMEWQANALAPKIQMPFHATKIKASEFIREYLKDRRTDRVIDVMEPVIGGVATFFGVSKQAAKIRLYELGYEEAVGTFIYLDGQYVKPHTFKKGFLKANQTFSISNRDAMMQCLHHPELGELLKQRSLLYVDSHFIINDPKYVVFDEAGQPLLTDYARYHMDECCLVFELSLIDGSNSYQREYFLECVLCRDINSQIIFEAKHLNSSSNLTIQEKAAQVKAYHQELLAIKRDLPFSFQNTLVELMRIQKMTVEELAEASGCSAKTIQRMRNDPDYGSLEKTVAVCIGLKLPPELSGELISRSGFTFRPTDAHLAYKHLLNACYHQSIYECDLFLESMGLTPLSTINQK